MEMFEESMMLVVLDSFALSSQIATMEEKLAKAKDWSRLLFGVIPEEYLQKCFATARVTHTGGYPISGYEIEQAYQVIKPAPQRKTAREYIAEAEAIAEAERPK